MRTASSLVVVGDDGEHRAEDLLRAMRMRLSTSTNTVGSTYQPFAKPARAAAAAGDLRALLLAGARCSPRRGRAGARRRAGRHRVVGSIGSPTGQRADRGDERLGDLGVALARGTRMRVCRRAGLAVVDERAGEQALRSRSRDVGVVEHDRRRLAAELERDALQLLAADRRRCAGPPPCCR